MYELVPPTSKVIEYESPYLKGVVFKVKVFDFSDYEKYQSLLLQTEEKDSESTYIELFKLGVKEIEGVEGKFSPNWGVIKSVVNKVVSINTVSDLEK